MRSDALIAPSQFHLAAPPKAVEPLLATVRGPSPVTLQEMGRLSQTVSNLLVAVLLACGSQAQQKPKPPPQHSAPSLDSGAIANGVYRNPTFGFSYKIAYGWVDRTQEMAEDSDGDSTEAKKSTVLLAAFERPPVAPGDSINSAVVVAAEAASTYPDLRNAAQYFDLVTASAKSKDLKVVNEPYDYPRGAMQLVRGDFSKPLGNLTLYQSTLVLLQKGYFVSFTFIDGSEDEVDSLIESLSFVAKASPPAHK
jgi:hypothetical protein